MAGHRLGALEGGQGGTFPLPMRPWAGGRVVVVMGTVAWRAGFGHCMG